jgi:glutaredoxin
MAEPSAPVPEVVLYTRAGCHLCDEAKAQLRELRRQASFTLREVDIDQDPALRQRYNDEVPVIFIHGRKAFKYRIDPRQFLQQLRSHLPAPAQQDPDR